MTNKETLANQTGNDPIEGKPMFTIEEIEGTPFKVINRENKFSLVIGNNRLSEEFKTKKEVIELLDTNKWEIIMTLIVIVSQQLDKKKWDNSIQS